MRWDLGLGLSSCSNSSGIQVSRVDVEVLLLLVAELLYPVSELLALGDDARDVGEVGHTVQALHPDVARGGADPLVDAVHIMPVGPGHVEAPGVVR